MSKKTQSVTWDLQTNVPQDTEIDNVIYLLKDRQASPLLNPSHSRWIAVPQHEHLKLAGLKAFPKNRSIFQRCPVCNNQNLCPTTLLVENEDTNTYLQDDLSAEFTFVVHCLNIKQACFGNIQFGQFLDNTFPIELFME